MFESVGMLAIVFSLVFVAYQIRQDQLLTRSELGAGSAELTAEISMMAIESEFQSTFVKMINQPGELSDDEIVEIDFFLRAVKTSFIRECYLAARGVFAECDGMIRSLMPRYFSNEFAKVWWQRYGQSMYIPDWISDEIATLDADGNRQDIADLKAEFQ